MAKFVPRQRKHRVLARERAQENARHDVDDTNQEELPAHKKDLAEKKARMKEELRQDGVKMSGKKAKRFEKYMDNKLRKDENRKLLAKLAQSKVDTSLFSSSRSLGQGHETKKQAMSRALREHQAGINGSDANEDLLFKKRAEPVEAESDDEDETESETSKAPVAIAETSAAKPVRDSATKPSEANIGSGLKRPLDVDGEGRPIIKKRQKRGGVASKPIVTPTQPVEDTDSQDSSEDEWNGFDSDAENSLDKDEQTDGGSDDDEDGDSEDGVDDDGSGESGDGDDSASGDEELDSKSKARSSAFKNWAQQQRNDALGFNPESSGVLEIPKPDNFVPRQAEQDPLPMELEQTKNTARKAYSINVTRSPGIQEARLKLPVVGEEQKLMEAIHDNDIVVICGATGSGKTTQVPQFLYEAGYGSPKSPTPGLIGVTQPRRVAAVSMAARVGQELGDHSKAVAYQIRFEGTVSAATAIKFMTDGVLLREIAQDITLRKYSAIIIDEAHERSVNTDILIGMLSRVIKLRLELSQEDPSIKPLKMVIMSATLRVEDMTMNPNLFSTSPPVLEVEGRQHPVTLHFSRRTTADYVEEAFNKISRGHRKLPPGNFLVFLTGRNEITHLSKRLKATFGGLTTAEAPKVQISAGEAPVEVEDIEFGDVDDFANGQDDDDILSIEEDGEEDEEDEFQIEEDQEAAPMKVQILPLYSLLPTQEQLRVFEPTPDGTRRIILATNVAETSLTIPGTRFVFDCGRSKERQYDRLSGVQSYEIGWISKASANQRSGRAGRTGPGHCYRLYSSAVYERDFRQFADPELLRMPIEGVVLQLKAMNLQHIVNFPFPTPPERASLAKAEKLLTYLSALTPSGQVTPVGSTMSIFPLSPRFAKILLVGKMHDCLHYTIALVAGLSAGEVFLPENQAVPALTANEDVAFRTNADVIAEDRQANVKRLFNEVHHNFCFLDDKSDAIKLLQVVGEFAHEPTEDWCERHFVRFKVLREIQQLRRQITDILRVNVPAFAALKFHDRLDTPSPKQVSALKQMVAAGFVDQVAIRADLAPVPPEQYRKPKRAIDVPYIPLMPLPRSSSSAAANGDASSSCVYIHPTSPLAFVSHQECPDYIVYSYLQRATPSGLDPQKKPKTRMHSLTNVTGGQLAGLAKGTPLISYGKPIKEVKTASSASGVAATQRECWVVPYLRAEGTGGQGWPLPATVVRQKKVPGKGWVVE